MATLLVAGLLAAISGIILIIMTLKQINSTGEPMKHITIKSLGLYVAPRTRKILDLSEYYVDSLGNLYSANSDTWELNKLKRRDLLLCSNKTLNSSGNIINTLRDKRGIKVTIERNKLDFYKLGLKPILDLTVSPTTHRHYQVITKQQRYIA